MKSLQVAWHHVRKSALASNNPDIKSAAQEFEENCSTKLLSIQSRLLKGTYQFPRAQGILKDRHKREASGKDPRPIVIATVEARVVQRAILDVLQSPEDSPLHIHLGKICEVNSSPFSVGGIPNGGVPVGIQKTLTALQDGYSFFFKSDIAGFFTKITHAPVADFVLEQTKDLRLAQLFTKALNVELANKERLGRYFDLFPHDGIGVAQGSSLSAFAGNVLLHNFDRQLNTPATRAYRYIDDVIIFGKTNEAVVTAKAAAKNALKPLGMHFYDPSKNPDKADQGHVRKGFVFLGCRIHDQRVTPDRNSIERALKKVDNEIFAAKAVIDRLITNNDARNCEFAFIQSLGRIDNSLRSWGKSYSFTTDRLPFKQMDGQIDAKLEHYKAWFEAKSKSFTAQQVRRALGIYLLTDTSLERLPSD